MTADDLLQRRRGEAFNAEEAVAARKILVSSADNVVQMAAKAQQGTEADVLAFMNAMSKHTAIQKQVSGMAAEAGRALSSFNIKVGDSNAALVDMINIAGGSDKLKTMAAQISTAGDIHQLNRMVRENMNPKLKDMALEVWINGLLSNPTTHIANAISNTITNVWAIPERYLAAKIGKAFGDQEIVEEEVLAQSFGLVQGMKDGLNLAWQALKTGEPADSLGRIETKSHQAISAEAFELSGMFGQAVDLVGHTVRIPGRLLTSSDEFFKAVAYRGELNAQVFRQAKSEGLEGDALAKRIGELMQDTPENIQAAAMDAKTYNTFTQPLGEVGSKVQALSNSHPALKVLLPFVRTPTNILKFVGERTPLGLLSKNIRSDIAAGGARRDVALARLSLGSMVMAVASDFSMSGDITGAGPADYKVAKIWRDQGYQPYSIRIGDTWYSYSRLDPLGAVLGLGADMAEILSQTSEADAGEMAAAASLSIAQNMTSKTYLRGIMDFVNAFTSAKADPENKNTVFKRYWQNLAASTIPSAVSNVARQVDPTMRQANSVVEKIKSRIPGYSKDLPPSRNMWGDPVLYSGSLGPDWASPIYANKMKNDPVNQTILDNQIPIAMPNKKVMGVDLKPWEYDQFVQLSAGIGLKGAKPLHDELKRLISKPSYKRATDGPEGGKAVQIRAVVNSYRKAAQAQLLKENPLLQNAVVEIRQEKARKLGGL